MPIPTPIDGAPLNYRSIITLPILPDKSKFSLDISGLASILGGPGAKSSLLLVHINKKRRWLGWYNSPGSYYQVDLLSGITPSTSLLRFIATSICGRDSFVDPGVLFGYDGQKGPKFRAPHSGLSIDKTGHLAALFANGCKEMEAKKVRGRETRSNSVTIAKFHNSPPDEQPLLGVDNRASIWASAPIIVSLGACIASALYSDWIAFFIILFGIMVNGLSCLVVGLGELTLFRPDIATGSLPGNGLLGSDKDIILLIGAEQAVSSITRGKFLLDYNRWSFHYSLLGLCSVLLLQSIIQILLVPQFSLFGQLLFIFSIAISWSYNAWLSTWDKGAIQKRMLNNLVKPKLIKYELGTRTTVVVFILLVLSRGEHYVNEGILNDVLPNDTEVWRSCKSTILDQLSNGREQKQFDISKCDCTHVPESERALLGALFSDAQTALEGFRQYQRDMESKQ